MNLQLRNDLTIKVTPFNLKDKINYLKLLEKTEGDIDMKELEKNYINPHIDINLQDATLEILEIIYILHKINEISLEKIEYKDTFICEKCANEFEVTFNQNDIIFKKINNNLFNDFKLIKVNNLDINVKFKSLTQNDRFELYKLSKQSIADYIIKDLLIHIDELNVSGEDIKDIQNYLLNKSTKIADAIYNYLNENNANFEIKKEVECPECNKAQIVKLDTIIDKLF